MCKLLYIGNLKVGGNGIDRAESFRSFGIEVIPFNIESYLSYGNRVQRSLGARFNFGSVIGILNNDLLRFIQDKKFDIAFIDKGVWIYPETVAYLKEASGMRMAVHYTPDPQIKFHRSRFFIESIPIYDLCVTTKNFEIEDYKNIGAQEVLKIYQGYGNRIKNYKGKIGDSSLTSDISFIGHYEKHYAETFKAISDLGKLSIWGRGWRRHCLFNSWLTGALKGDGLWGEQYSGALSAAKISIGVLSKWIPETSTTRSFEIPAAGTFLLAERTSEHCELFQEGREAEFFSSKEELRDKVKFFLKNEEQREKIARNGHLRTMRSGYSVRDQFSKIVKWMRKRIM